MPINVRFVAADNKQTTRNVLDDPKADISQRACSCLAS